MMKVLPWRVDELITAAGLFDLFASHAIDDRYRTCIGNQQMVDSSLSHSGLNSWSAVPCSSLNEGLSESGGHSTHRNLPAVGQDSILADADPAVHQPESDHILSPHPQGSLR